MADFPQTPGTETLYRLWDGKATVFGPSVLEVCLAAQTQINGFLQRWNTKIWEPLTAEEYSILANQF